MTFKIVVLRSSDDLSFINCDSLLYSSTIH